MTSTNYVAGIIRILEEPKLKTFKNGTIMTQFRAELPKFKDTLVVNLTFWGNLAQKVTTCYKTNDYIMIESYVSLRDDINKISSKGLVRKKIELTVLKVYPLYSTLNHSEDLITDASKS